MSFTRPRIASWLRLLGLIGFYGGIFFLVVTTLSAFVYERPTPSTADLLLSGVPYYATIGIGVLLLLVSHKVDPSTGANWANLWSVFRAILSMILFIVGLVGMAGALVRALFAEASNITTQTDNFTPIIRQSAIVFVVGIVCLWLSRLVSGKSGPVQRYPLDWGKRKRRAKPRMP